MIKRKFGLGLAPLKILSKPVPPRQQEPPRLPVPDEWVQYSPPDSPVIQRRAPLDPKTELELRKACAVILQDFKPSDSGIEPALRAREILRVDDVDRHPPARPHWVTDSNGPPTGNPLTGQLLPPAQESGRESNRSRTGFRQDAALKDLFANDLFSNDIVHPSMHTVAKRPVIVRAETFEENVLAPAPSHVSTSREPLSPPRKATTEQASLTTPPRGNNSHISSASTEGSYHTGTGSTDWPRSASTTFTSPSVNSMRFSDQVYSELNTARDVDVAPERPKLVIDGLRRGKGSEDFSWKPFDSKPHSVVALDAISSKGSTIVGEPLEKPKSSAVVTSTTSTTASAAKSTDVPVAESPSRRGWHSWGFRRHGQTSQAPANATSDEPSAAADVNLNRTLPPLPSLDSYKSEDDPPKEVVSPITPITPATTHIATMLKSGETTAKIGSPKLVEVSRVQDSAHAAKARNADTSPVMEMKKYFVEPGTNVIRSRPDTDVARSRPDTANSKRPPSILKSTASSVKESSTYRNNASLSRDATSTQPAKTTPEMREIDSNNKDFTMPSFSRPHPRSRPETRLSADAFDFDELMSAMREGIKTPNEANSQFPKQGTPALDSSKRDTSASAAATARNPTHSASSLSISTTATSTTNSTTANPLAPPTAPWATNTSFLIGPNSSATAAAAAAHHTAHSSSTSMTSTSTATALPTPPTPPSHSYPQPQPQPQPQPLYPATAAPDRPRGLRKVLSSIHRDPTAPLNQEGRPRSSSRSRTWTGTGAGSSRSRSKVWVPPPTPNRGAWGPTRSVTSLDKWGVDENGADVYASGNGPVMGGGGGSLRGGWGGFGGGVGVNGQLGVDVEEMEEEEEACAAPVIRF